MYLSLINTYSGTYPFIFSDDIRSLNRWLMASTRTRLIASLLASLVAGHFALDKAYYHAAVV